MSDFHTVRGFEEVWRPPVRPRRVTPQALLGGRQARGGSDMRARLERLVNRAPEVMVKVTGRTRDPGHLRAHLDYISRNGAIELETPDGGLIAGRAEVKALALDWSADQLADRRTRADAPFSHSVILSMPEGTNPLALRDAARAFAVDVFTRGHGDRSKGGHDYVFALHTDTPRPHVHLSICSRGDRGQRLNPKKADLELWRQVFAEKLRERGVEAEATPRRARGVTRKAERQPLRKIRERHEAGQGAPANVRRSAYREAARAAFQGEAARNPWEAGLLKRQAKVRGLYLAQAQILRRSLDPADHALGVKLETFIQSMPRPDSQRLALARELRAANEGLILGRDDKGKDRSR